MNEVTKTVKWIVEENVFDGDAKPIIDELKKHGYEYHIHNYPVFNKIDYPLSSNDCVLVYGALSTVRMAMRNSPWIPCAWCTLENFKCSTYYIHYPEYLLNKDYALVPAADLLRQKNLFFDMFGKSGQIFIRPDSGYKEFAGRLVSYMELDEDALGFGYYHDNPSLLVLVSSPKIIEKEWRFVVAEGKVITGCQYKDTYEGELEVDKSPKIDPSALEFASKIAENKFQPDPIYTLDICQTDKKEFKLLELNGFSTSSMYDCDASIIVKTASEMAFNEWKIY